MPRRLRRSFRGFGDALTAADAGLAGYCNGRLLRSIDGQFDVFVTVDKSIQHQQNLAAYDVAFVLLRARSNDIVDVEPLVAQLLGRWTELEKRKLLVLD